MHTYPNFSILIPCYNSARFIRQTVEAAIDQSHPASEIIVVDDKSTDASLTILSQLPVKVICHEINKGPAYARNTALIASSGDIVVFIDSDAYADRDLIQMFLTAYLYADPMVAGIGGCGIEMNVQTKYDKWRVNHSKLNYGLNDHQNVDYLFGLCSSYKREVLLNIGGFDPFFNTSAGEELDLGYRLKRAGYRLDYFANAKVYHQHTDSAETLMRTQAKYYYWSYFAKKRNHKWPWTLFVGTIRRLFTDAIFDLVVNRDINQVKISILIFMIKIKSLIKAAQSKPIGTSEFNFLGGEHCP